jgi:hypothetical protein
LCIQEAKNNNAARLLGKLQHIVAQANNASGQSQFIAFRHVGRFDSLVIAVALELTAPEATEVHIVLSVVILKDRRVNGVAATDRVGQRNERTGRSITNSNPNAENVVLILQREIEVILTVLFSNVAVPKLPAGPWNLANVENLAMVNNLAVERIVA